MHIKSFMIMVVILFRCSMTSLSLVEVCLKTDMWKTYQEDVNNAEGLNGGITGLEQNYTGVCLVII